MQVPASCLHLPHAEMGDVPCVPGFSHQITVIHQALYWVTLMDDEKLAKALGAKNLGGVNDYSEYISTKLSDSHCDKEPKGHQ